MADETRKPSGEPAPSDAVFQRFDPPHRWTGRERRPEEEAERQSVEVEAVSAAEVWDSPDEQVRLQANQLAGHLRARLHELDRRESHLHSQVASQDNELRAHRLWMQERERELAERLSQADQQANELQQRSAALAAAQLGWEQQQQEHLELYRAREMDIVTRERRLDELSRRLQTEQQALDTAKRTLAHDQRRLEDWVRCEQQKLVAGQESQQQLQRRLLSRLEKHREALAEREERGLLRLQQAQSTSLQRSAAEFAHKQYLLQQLQTQLNRQCEELHQEQQQWLHDRELREEELLQQQETLAAQRDQHEREWQERAGELKKRSEQLDSQHTALERLQKELMRRNRESLELRLATEELYCRLENQLGAPTLTRGISEVRERLADHFRWAISTLEEKQLELRDLTAGLEGQHLALRQQQQELQEWLRKRHQELDALSARLATQRDKLDSRERTLRDKEREWTRERRDLQKQIRELAAQFLSSSAAGARAA